MTQMSFSDVEYAGKRKRTRREVFLAEMEQVMPWDALLGLIEPVYPKPGNGRQPYALNTMLRVHLMQQWFGYWSSQDFVDTYTRQRNRWR